MSDNYLKIGDVADLINTTVRTIRYYEEEQLIEPHRTDGGTRLYDNFHVARLKAIIHLADNGFSLDTIRLIAKTRTTCSTGDEGSNKVSIVIEHAIKDTEHQINKLKKLQSELKAAHKQVKQCEGCENVPSSQGCPTCPINENLRRIEVLNLIWE